MSSRSLRPRGRKITASALAATLGLAGLGMAATPAGATEPTVTDRLAGQTRYSTAVDIATEEFPDATTAILATGEKFPDALAGSGIAGKHNAPILLTQSDDLPDVVDTYLQGSNITNVIVLGGVDAISEDVVAELDGMTVERIAGDDRFETAAEIALEIGAPDINGENTVFVATGFEFADALAAGPLAFHGPTDAEGDSVPILLVGDDVPASTETALDALGAERIIILGGTNAVSATTEAELETMGDTEAERLDGATRFETAQEIAQFAITEFGFAAQEAAIANGFVFADALAGGPYGGVNEAPILLVTETDVPDATEAFLTNNCESVDMVTALGGTVRINDTVLAEAGQLAQCEITTNQAFAVAGDAEQVRTDETVTFNVTGITAENVDVALVPCEAFTVDADGIVTFLDEDATANQADLVNANVVTEEADIATIDGVSGAFGDFEDNVVVTDGDLTVTTTAAAADGCFALVVFDDPDDDDVLDLNADGTPLAEELFGVSGATVVATPVAVNASPESALNPFGETHTVTAQLTNNGDETVAEPIAEADVSVRFTLSEVPEATVENTTTGDGVFTEADCAAGTVIQVENATTDAEGTAAFSFTDQDPATAEGNDSFFCVLVQADTDGNGIDAGDPSDTVTKQFTDQASTAAALQLTPEQDVNPVGTQHTVTATAVDQFGDSVSGASVTFEVNREGANNPLLTATRQTGTDGTVTFTYTGPETQADDVIVACIDNDAAGTAEQGCDAVVSFVDDPNTTTVNEENTATGGDEVDDFAVKFFVETATLATQDTGADSCVLAADLTGDTVDVEDSNTGDANLRFAFDGDDRFNLNGTGVNQATFEAALTEGDRIQVDFEPGGISTFTLVDDDDCTAGEGETSTGGTVVGTAAPTATDATFFEASNNTNAGTFGDTIGDAITVTYDEPIVLDQATGSITITGDQTITYECNIDSDANTTADITCVADGNVLTVTLTDNAAGRSDVVIDNLNDVVNETGGVTDIDGNLDEGFPVAIDAA